MAIRRKSKRRSPNASANAKNRKALWGTYREMEKKIHKAYAKIRTDLKRKASPQIILQDRNQLLLLLGECNYMAKEWMRFARAKTKGR